MRPRKFFDPSHRKRKPLPPGSAPAPGNTPAPGKTSGTPGSASGSPAGKSVPPKQPSAGASQTPRPSAGGKPYSPKPAGAVPPRTPASKPYASKPYASKPYASKPYAPKPYADKRGPYKPASGSTSRPPRPSGPPARFPSRAASPAPQRTDWNPVAQWYDELVGDQGSEFQQQVVIPGVLRMLGAGPGDQILDIACGQGVLCRLLHQRKAKPVGVDASLDLLGLAKQRSDPSIPFLLGDARHLSAVRELVPESFHAAVCVLAIQDMDPIQPVFDSAAQLLKPGGRIVLAMTHPCFRVPKQSAWDWDAQRSVQYRRIDRYMTAAREPIIAHPGKPSSSLHTWSFHRPLQTYIRALAKAGLFIDALEEWTSHKVSDSGPRAMAENLARREIPLFLALRAVKVKGIESKEPKESKESKEAAE